MLSYRAFDNYKVNMTLDMKLCLCVCLSQRLLDQCDKMKYGISSAIVLLDCNVMMLGERLKHD